jgi:UDPglucose 6-dehydrogenase
VDADVQDVLNGLSLDDRIGSKFLQPGPGWGGSCFPKDTKALVAHGESIGAPMSMIQEAIRANEEHMSLIGNLIAQAASQQSLTDPKIAILGLAFKANTDDVRDSPAVKIADALSQTYSNIAVYDPMAKLDSGLSKFRSDDLDTTILNADVIAILTEWDEFSQLSPEYLRNLMRGKHIVDARYILELNQFQDSSFQVRVLGKSR